MTPCGLFRWGHPRWSVGSHNEVTFGFYLLHLTAASLGSKRSTRRTEIEWNSFGFLLLYWSELACGRKVCFSDQRKCSATENVLMPIERLWNRQSKVVTGCSLKRPDVKLNLCVGVQVIRSYSNEISALWNPVPVFERKIQTSSLKTNFRESRIRFCARLMFCLSDTVLYWWNNWEEWGHKGGTLPHDLHQPNPNFQKQILLANLGLKITFWYFMCVRSFPPVQRYEWALAMSLSSA